MTISVLLEGSAAPALIDDDDDVLVNQFEWRAEAIHNTIYAIARRQGSLRMHRLVMGFPASQVDHRDRNGLNNQKGNLRLASASLNQANRGIFPHSSQYKGVCRVTTRTGTRAWQAQIQSQFLGWYDIEEEAAVAYDIAARARFGSYARTNFPPDTVVIPQRRSQLSLSSEQRGELVTLRCLGATESSLQAIFGVSRSTVQRTCRGILAPYRTKGSSHHALALLNRSHEDLFRMIEARTKPEDETTTQRSRRVE